MRVGFVGTGKLGLQVSLVYATKGHDVICYDLNSGFYDGSKTYSHIYSEELCPDKRIPLKDWLPERTSLKYKHGSLEDVVFNSDIIFVAIQTPHEKKYEGVSRLTTERKDFDYEFLKSGLSRLSAEVDKCGRDIPVIIISTVLPGTIRREILPVISSRVKICYNPYFIAMGTVAHDCLNPEFILLGNHDEVAKNTVENFYKTICDRPVFSTTLENAELIKVCYNTFISTKVAIANTIMEICHYSDNTDCDTVIDALSMASNRLISPAYLRGGMGDGGGCHPRDNIALSWYSKHVGMRFDWFESIMMAREKQTDFLADIIEKEHMKNNNMPITILGFAFKPNTAITTGSATLLLMDILSERNIPFTHHDPLVNKNSSPPTECGIYFIGCKHSAFNEYSLPAGSIVIDPHRAFASIISSGTYIPVGRTLDE